VSEILSSDVYMAFNKLVKSISFSSSSICTVLCIPSPNHSAGETCFKVQTLLAYDNFVQVECRVTLLENNLTIRVVTIVEAVTNRSQVGGVSKSNHSQCLVCTSKLSQITTQATSTKIVKYL
jgi:hypothetical protein